MSTSYTVNAGLGCPALDDSGWNVPIQATINLLDSLAPIGSLACRFREIPSTSLFVSFAAGTFRTSTGSVGSYAGATVAAPASATTYYWLTDSGTLTTGSGWPSGPYVPLAVVVAGSSTVTSVTDARSPYGSVGVGGRVAVAARTATYAILPTDGLVELDATLGAFTATLPSAATNPGMVVRPVKVDVSVNAVTIATTGGQTINGASTLSLASQWSGKTLVSDGSNWVAF